MSNKAYGQNSQTSDIAVMLSPAQAGALLGVTAETIRRWINDGTLPAVRIGDRYRVRREDVDGLVKAA